MGGPGWGGDEIAVDMDAVDWRFNVFTAGESHIRTACRVGGATSNFQNVGRGQNL